MHKNPKNVVLVKDSLTSGTLILMKTEPIMECHVKSYFMKNISN